MGIPFPFDTTNMNPTSAHPTPLQELNPDSRLHMEAYMVRLSGTEWEIRRLCGTSAGNPA